MEKNGNVLMEKYEFGKLLGQGTFAKVYHARNIKSGQSVAIKVIDKEKILRVGLIDQTKREISVMSLVEHPNVVQLYEVMATKTKIYFAMEYAKGGELFNKVARGRLDEDSTRNYFQQLICAVNFCHGRGVYHRDLKPENLLLDENGTLKVSDFGLCALVESKRQDGLLHTTCGTPAYVAPEVISRKGYNGAKADVWSCGIILFVLLAGHLPFHDSNLMNLYKKISKAQYKCPGWFPSDIRKLLSRILDPNPNTRISVSEIMENPWFRKGLGSKGPTPAIDAAASKPEQGFFKPMNLNAFDIISLSSGFDLSGLFAECDRRKEVKFTSRQTASAIILKLEDVARQLGLCVSKEGGFLRMMKGPADGGLWCIDAGIFEFSPEFYLVELKTGGDGLKFQEMVRQDLRPALEDIVWAWQGAHQLQPCY